MIIYVDGDDLVAHFATIEDPLATGDARGDRQNATRWLARYCEMRGCRGVLVFANEDPADVRPPTERFAQVEVQNLTYGAKKQLVIGGAANKAAGLERTLVVTDDWRLVESLRAGRAKVLGAAQFVSQARTAMGSSDDVVPDEPDEKFTGVTDDEVGFWLDMFDAEDG